MTADAEETLHAVCVYGPQHVAAVRDILIPALAAQRLPAGRRLTLHLLNYRDSQALLADVSQEGLVVRDWSATRGDLHVGFGEGVNYLVSCAAPEHSFFLINPDSFPMANCLAALLEHFEREEQAGIVEARQWPSEHPKEYDPRTLETPWASGAFSLISAKAFRRVGGFDPVYFLYNEDVDLSWLIRLAGYRILYARDAVAAHFTGLLSYRPDRFYPEHFFSSRNFLTISYKFFGDPGEAQALALLRTTGLPQPLQEQILASYRQIKPAIRRYLGEVSDATIKITGFNQYHELRAL